MRSDKHCTHKASARDSRLANAHAKLLGLCELVISTSNTAWILVSSTGIMHSDRDLELAAQQLAKFRVDGEAYHKTQDDVLEKYAALMEDFKRLKSDYEEERDSRERYKQLAKGQERNPFVLVS